MTALITGKKKTTKSETPRKTEIVLNRRQADQLVKIFTHFTATNWFTITETYDSGIGPTIKVSFNLFEDEISEPDTQVDITDVTSW